MGPIKADNLITIENPICEWEEYQVLVHPDGTTEWWLIMKDPDTGEMVHYEHTPPVHLNPYLPG